MPVERIEQQRTRPLEHLVDVADDEERPDLAALAPLARDLDGELETSSTVSRIAEQRALFTAEPKMTSREGLPFVAMPAQRR